MAEIPRFFFSHARQDIEERDGLLNTFFEDLESRLAQWAGVNYKEVPLATIDKRTEQGKNWNAELSAALKADKTLVAIYTPVFFERENCGKELGIFLLRSGNLGFGLGGALTGVENVIPIRWMKDRAYRSNGKDDGVIPPFLREIEDTPADPGRDPDRAKIIAKYRRQGMRNCVNTAEYSELLDLFAERLRDAPPLRSGQAADFNSAIDAFNYDWSKHFGQPPPPPQTPSATMAAPGGLQTLVVYYVTPRNAVIDSTNVNFADCLIAEPQSGQAQGTDAGLAALVIDIRAAALSEGLSVFHAASIPPVPENPATLLTRLQYNAAMNIVSMVVIDPQILAAGASSAQYQSIESIIRSDAWKGPVLVPTFERTVAEVEGLLKPFASLLVRRPAVLAQENRAQSLHSVILAARAKAFQSGELKPVSTDTLPLISAAGQKPRP